MDEIFQKLLASELLSEEAKTEISTKWASAVDQYKELVREEVTMEVRAEIAEQWSSEREALVEKVQTFVEGKLAEEFAELNGDVERFRDLEAEHAEKLVEARHEMAAKLSEEIEELINKIDAFFELRLSEEFDELREDIEVVKQNEFGRRLFEAFATTFNTSFVDEDSTQAKLIDAAAKLEEAQSAIAALEDQTAKLLREAKLDKVLAPLSGKKREQMEFVLASVETARLEEAFNHFIGRVLKEEAAPAPTAVIEATTVIEAPRAGTVVTGNELQEAVSTATTTDKHAALKKLAGITH